MPAFQVVSEYTPSGDQPQAIAKLAQGIEDGLREQIARDADEARAYFRENDL